MNLAALVCFGLLILYALVVTGISSRQLAADAKRTWLHLALIGSVLCAGVSLGAGYFSSLARVSTHQASASTVSVAWLMIGLLTLWTPIGISRCWVEGQRLDRLRLWSCTLIGGVLGAAIGVAAMFVIGLLLFEQTPDDIANGVQAMLYLVTAGPLSGFIGLVVGLCLGYRAGRSSVNHARYHARFRHEEPGFPVLPIKSPSTALTQASLPASPPQSPPGPAR